VGTGEVGGAATTTALVAAVIDAACCGSATVTACYASAATGSGSIVIAAGRGSVALAALCEPPPAAVAVLAPTCDALDEHHLVGTTASVLSTLACARGGTVGATLRTRRQ
jgi:hypothetical protein